MVKFISKLGVLFGGNPKKKDTPKKAGPKPSKPKAKPSKPQKKPAKPKSTPRQAKPKPSATTQAKNSHSTQAKPKPGAGTHAVQKPAATLQKKPVAVVAKPQMKPAVALAKEQLRSVVLFTTTTCPDCASARKLVGDVRRIARDTVFREVDLSTREGELEGLLHGVVQSPSFVINGRLVFRGVLPAREQLARVINEGAPQ